MNHHLSAPAAAASMPSSGDSSLDAALSFLAKEENLAAGADWTVMETPISKVLLVGPHAFKFKRSVRLPYVNYATAQERLREMQRRTNADFAQTIARHAGMLKNADDLAQCSSWQQQAYAEQLGRWNQYALELIQVASEGQALSQGALRESMAQAQQAYAALAAHTPTMPYIFPMAGESEPPASRKPNSQRASAH